MTWWPKNSQNPEIKHERAQFRGSEVAGAGGGRQNPEIEHVRAQFWGCEVVGAGVVQLA